MQASQEHHEAFDSKCKKVLKSEEQNTLLQDSLHLSYWNTLIATNRLVTSNGQYVNIWGYTLHTSTKNIYLKGHKRQQYHYYVGRTDHHRLNNTCKLYSTA